MTDQTDLQRTATRVDALVRPRASAGLVAIVVLAAEVLAMVVAWGVSELDRAQADPILVTVAVLAAAVTSLSLFVRTGQSAEPGNTWLASGWLVVAVLAGTTVTHLPLSATDPTGAGIDRALLTVLVWTGALAVAVSGADIRPQSRSLPWVLMIGFGLLGSIGGLTVPDGALLARSGPTFGYGLMSGMTLVLAMGASVWWLLRWNDRGGWALTWTGVGLVLMTLGLTLQVAAPFGNDRAWVAATALVLSSLIVPGVGAAVGALGLAGAHTLARRQLVQNLKDAPDVQVPAASEGDEAAPDPLAQLPLVDALDVQLGTVVNVETGEPTGAVATAVLPGTGLSPDWWRAQAASLGLQDKLEAVLATRALDVARRERADAWLLLPVAADGLSPALLDLLSGSRAGHLVAVVRGGGARLGDRLRQLQERGITTGVWLDGNLQPRVIKAVAEAKPSLLVIDGRRALGITQDEQVRGTIADIVAFARDHDLAVMVDGVDDTASFAVLREIGVRYAAGEAAVASAPVAHAAVAPSGVELIEAAGLRGPAAPPRT